MAIAIAAIALAVLLLRVWLSIEQHGGVLAGLAYLSQFFTILTNVLVMIGMATIGLGVRRVDKLMAMVVVAIFGVGVVYHTLLAHLWDPQGLVWLADEGVHSVIPALALSWWLIYAPKGLFDWRDIPFSGAWPLAYCIYVLIRAEWTAFYPYPFLNLPEIGWSRLCLNVVGLLLAFAMFAVIILVLERVAVKLSRAKPQVDS